MLEKVISTGNNSEDPLADLRNELKTTSDLFQYLLMKVEDESEKKTTQSNLASRWNIHSPSSISKYLAGKQTPRIERLERILEKEGLTLDNFPLFKKSHSLIGLKLNQQDHLIDQLVEGKSVSEIEESFKERGWQINQARLRYHYNHISQILEIDKTAAQTKQPIEVTSYEVNSAIKLFESIHASKKKTKGGMGYNPQAGYTFENFAEFITRLIDPYSNIATQYCLNVKYDEEGLFHTTDITDMIVDGKIIDFKLGRFDPKEIKRQLVDQYESAKKRYKQLSKQDTPSNFLLPDPQVYVVIGDKKTKYTQRLNEILEDQPNIQAYHFNEIIGQIDLFSIILKDEEIEKILENTEDPKLIKTCNLLKKSYSAIRSMEKIGTKVFRDLPVTLGKMSTSVLENVGKAISPILDQDPEKLGKMQDKINDIDLGLYIPGNSKDGINQMIKLHSLITSQYINNRVIPEGEFKAWRDFFLLGNRFLETYTDKMKNNEINDYQKVNTSFYFLNVINNMRMALEHISVANVLKRERSIEKNDELYRPLFNILGIKLEDVDRSQHQNQCYIEEDGELYLTKRVNKRLASESQISKLERLCESHGIKVEFPEIITPKFLKEIKNKINEEKERIKEAKEYPAQSPEKSIAPASTPAEEYQDEIPLKDPHSSQLESNIDNSILSGLSANLTEIKNNHQFRSYCNRLMKYGLINIREPKENFLDGQFTHVPFLDYINMETMDFFDPKLMMENVNTLGKEYWSEILQYGTIPVWSFWYGQKTGIKDLIMFDITGLKEELYHFADHWNPQDPESEIPPILNTKNIRDKKKRKKEKKTIEFKEIKSLEDFLKNIEDKVNEKVKEINEIPGVDEKYYKSFMKTIQKDKHASEEIKEKALKGLIFNYATHSNSLPLFHLYECLEVIEKTRFLDEAIGTYTAMYYLRNRLGISDVDQDIQKAYQLRRKKIKDIKEASKKKNGKNGNNKKNGQNLEKKSDEREFNTINNIIGSINDNLEVFDKYIAQHGLDKVVFSMLASDNNSEASEKIHAGDIQYYKISQNSKNYAPTSVISKLAKTQKNIKNRMLKEELAPAAASTLALPAIAGVAAHYLGQSPEMVIDTVQLTGSLGLGAGLTSIMPPHYGKLLKKTFFYSLLPIMVMTDTMGLGEYSMTSLGLYTSGIISGKIMNHNNNLDKTIKYFRSLPKKMFKREDNPKPI